MDDNLNVFNVDIGLSTFLFFANLLKKFAISSSQ